MAASAYTALTHPVVRRISTTSVDASQHLNGDVRLAGNNRGKEWYVLLDLEVFIQAVVEVIGPPTAEPAA